MNQRGRDPILPTQRIPRGRDPIFSTQRMPRRGDPILSTQRFSKKTNEEAMIYFKKFRAARADLLRISEENNGSVDGGVMWMKMVALQRENAFCVNHSCKKLG